MSFMNGVQLKYPWLTNFICLNLHYITILVWLVPCKPGLAVSINQLFHKNTSFWLSCPKLVQNPCLVSPAHMLRRNVNLKKKQASPYFQYTGIPFQFCFTSSNLKITIYRNTGTKYLQHIMDYTSDSHWEYSQFKNLCTWML